MDTRPAHRPMDATRFAAGEFAFPAPRLKSTLRYAGDSFMKRMLIVVALAGISTSAGGCCCGRGLCCLWPQPAPVAPAPVPACPPPAYDPCATPPVTYGPPPATTYAPGYPAGTPVYTPAPQW
jgi:hypothetical protein